MEDNFNNEKSTIPNNKETSTKVKRNKVKVAIISMVIILLFGMQVYASVNGYGNVFFMIKYLTTQEKQSGKDEIFSDKEITLSYRSIELTEGLKIQANKLQVKDGKSKVFLLIKSQNDKLLPLKYEVTEKGNEEEITKITGRKPDNTDYFEYEDVLILDYEVDETKTISLKISDSNKNELGNLEINLETREIVVKGEKKAEQISEIELKKYLNIFALLNDASGYTESDNLIEIATKIQSLNENNEGTIVKRETINEIVKQIYGENAKFETIKNAKNKDVQILKNMKVGVYEKQTDTYDLMEHDRYGYCLKIEDINFENDIYTVKYVYSLSDQDVEEVEGLPQYETTIKLRRNEDNLYSKYQIVSFEKGTEIKDTVSTNTNEEETNLTNVTNYTTSMNWKTYESTSAGLSFEYPTDLALKENPKENVIVEMTGEVIGKDVDTGKAIKSNLTIRLYSTQKVGKEEVKDFSMGYTGYTTNKGYKWFNNYINGYNTPGSAGYKKIENYVNYQEIGNGTYLQRMIEFEADNRDNFKVTNIINRLVGSTELLNIPSDITYNNTNNTVESKEELMNLNNWIQYWPDIGMKFKLPKNFEQGEVQEIPGVISVNMSGTINISGNDVPIKMSLYTEIYKNDIDNMWDILEYNLDRTVKSTDSKSWSDWYPLKEDCVPTSPLNDYIRRSYGRVRGDMVEKIIFDMQTNRGIDVPHYTFIRNVLESVSSTSR